MNRLLLWVAPLAYLALVGDAHAQLSPTVRPAPYGPTQRTTLSPYLNLFRGGDPASNYYLGVRPEFNQRSINQQFRSTLQGLEQRETTLPPEEDPLLTDPGLPSTGHPTAFNATGNYFNSGSPMTRPRTQAARPAAKQAPRRGR
jgi:hypothetical protein